MDCFVASLLAMTGMDFGAQSKRRFKHHCCCKTFIGEDVSKRSLRDGAAHRQGVAPVYNAYARVSGDPAFAGKQGDYQALLRPLFMLSFLVDDFLAENDFYGAPRVMLSSASSKTAFGLAHLVHGRNGIKVIGITSASNADFVK